MVPIHFQFFVFVSLSWTTYKVAEKVEWNSFQFFVFVSKDMTGIVKFTDLQPYLLSVLCVCIRISRKKLKAAKKLGARVFQFFVFVSEVLL